MAFEQTYPLFAAGPRADLTWAYLTAVINGAAQPVVNNSETSQGFTLTGTAGIYTLVFPKCRFASIAPFWRPPAVANNRFVYVLSGVDPTLGLATINVAAAVAGGAANPDSVANELDLLILLGF